MATYTKETALYDTGAIATDIANAGTTATSYITQVDSQGIWVTPSALKPTNTETGAGATGARINADGMEIFQNGDAVAHYGDYARIGKDGEANTTISPGEVVISAGNNIDALRITPDGNTQKARFTIYTNRKILAGASLTYTHPSAADSNTNIVYTLTPEGSSSSKMITVTKGQTTATTTVTSPFMFEYSATTSAITIKNNESSTPIILLVVSYTKSATVPLIKGGGVLALGSSPRATDFGTVFAVGNGTASFNAFTVFDTGLVTIHGGVGSVGSITLDGRTGYVDALSYSLSGTEIADHVVEQGTSDIWTYRKWSSGIAECWGCQDIPSTTYSANGGYRSISAGLPSGLFITTPDIVIACGRINGLVQTDIGFTSPNNASTIQTYLINRAGSAVTQAGKVYWSVKGRWK